MKWLLLCVLVFSAVSTSAQAPVITQTTPVVNQGKTLQFTETLSEPGTWSCSGCAGGITAGGLYTAPATVTPQSSYGGFQVFANNNIFNTRIDSLAVDSHSAAWIAGAGTVPFSIREISFAVNYVDGSTPTQNMIFGDTPGNNGVFPIPAYPGAKIESGWLTRRNFNYDHHLMSIDQRDGTFREMYDYETRIQTTGASVTGNVATFTFATDPRNLAGASLQTGDTLVGTGGFTGADTYFNVSPVTITATSSNSVSFALTHANAVATSNGFIVLLAGGNPTPYDAISGIAYLNSTYGLPNSQGGSSDAAGLYIMPLALHLQEMEQAIANAGTIKHALRMTLQNGFICGSSLANACGNNAVGTRHIWPATAEAFAGAGIIPYGARFRLKASYNISGFSSIAQIILTALKQYGLILADGGTGWASQPEAAAWPKTIDDAFNEVSAAGIAPSNFEAVDESALMVSSTSGLTTNNREIVTFTRTSDSATASVDVVLIGVTVGLPVDAKFIQAGTAAQQFTAYVHGGNNNTVTWTMSPSIGTLTSGGLYTPPATQAAVASTTVTATSTDNASIKATMTVWLFPTGSIFIRPSATAAYTDSHGNVWAPAVEAVSGGHLSCCGYLGAGPWPAVTDIADYYYKCYAFGDGYFTFSVPNGSYTITIKLGNDNGVGVSIDTLESQGVIAYADKDITLLAGGTYKPLDFVINTTVTNGILSFVLRKPPTGVETFVNALQIDRTGVAVGTTLTPGMKVTSRMSLK